MLTQVTKADPNLIKEAYGIIKEPEIEKMLEEAIEMHSERGKIPVEVIEESPRHLGVIIARASRAHKKALMYEKEEILDEQNFVLPGTIGAQLQ